MVTVLSRRRQINGVQIKYHLSNLLLRKSTLELRQLIEPSVVSTCPSAVTTRDLSVVKSLILIKFPLSEKLRNNDDTELNCYSV